MINNRPTIKGVNKEGQEIDVKNPKFSHAFIYVCDLNQKDTFTTLNEYFKAFQQVEESQRKGLIDNDKFFAKKIVIGNKYDMSDTQWFDQAFNESAFTREGGVNQINPFLCSALTNFNVENTFRSLLWSICEDSLIEHLFEEEQKNAKRGGMNPNSGALERNQGLAFNKKDELPERNI